MIHGKVRWFSSEKGYGFITGGTKDYFIQHKEILGDGFKTLKEGDNVTFEPSRSPKGLVALNLRLKNHKNM